jgi:N-acetylmuramoyl-L-alanine amidase
MENDPSSIVDYLKSQNQPSDFESRRRLAAQYGIAPYTGSAEQNTRLLGILRGPRVAPPSVTPAPTLSIWNTISNWFKRS